MALFLNAVYWHTAISSREELLLLQSLPFFCTAHLRLWLWYLQAQEDQASAMLDSRSSSPKPQDLPQRAWLLPRWWNKTDPFGLCRSLKIPMVWTRLLPVSWRPQKGISAQSALPYCHEDDGFVLIKQNYGVLYGHKSSEIPFPEPVQPG